MTEEPENLVLPLLRGMRSELGEMRADIRDLEVNSATKADLNEPRDEGNSNINSLRADVASGLIVMRKELSEQIVGLRRAVIDYHSTVVGHGMIISEL